jgi:hypothetical protein
VRVFQLTAAQQAILDHQPQLALAPHEIISALQLTSNEESQPTSLASSTKREEMPAALARQNMQDG